MRYRLARTGSPPGARCSSAASVGGRADRDARIPGWAQLATGWRLVDSDRMGAEVHLWRVAVGEQLIEIDRAPLNLESRLQDWLVRDISILDPALR